MSQVYTQAAPYGNNGQPQYPQTAYQGAQPPPAAYATPPAQQGYPAEKDKGLPPQAYQQQQPQATPGMVHPGGPGGNRNALNLPMGAQGRPWSYDLFDCFGDAGTCLMAYFAPCVIYGQNKRRLDHLTTHGSPDPQSGEIASGDCCMHCCLTACGWGWVLQMGVRAGVRSRYHIEGGSCGDCMSAWCCTPCELTQEARELELEERSLGRPGPGVMAG